MAITKKQIKIVEIAEKMAEGKPEDVALILLKEIDRVEEEAKKELTDKFANLREDINKKKIETDLAFKKIQLKKGDKGERGEKGDTGEKGADGKNGVDGKDGKNGIDGKDGLDGEKGEQGEKGTSGADGSPDTPEMIKGKLETLDGDDRIGVKSIKGLRTWIKKLDKKLVYTGTGSGTPGGHVKFYDLSDQLDGSTRIFSMPAFYRIVSIHLSSFPNILRPIIDYTVDGTDFKITVTSEIDDDSLAEDQTMHVVYAEA